MRQFIKKVVCAGLAMAMVCSGSSTAFAAETEHYQNVEDVLEVNEDDMSLDLSDVDLTKSFTETNTVLGENDEEITVSVSYEPVQNKARGTSTNNASVGTWTSTVDYGVISMSYKFDLTKSNGAWKMSNARSHTYSGLFCSFKNASLKISRATAKTNFPCEINASVNASIFDNAWVKLYSGTWLMTTTVNTKGKMTLTWN